MKVIGSGTCRSPGFGLGLFFTLMGIKLVGTSSIFSIRCSLIKLQMPIIHHIIMYWTAVNSPEVFTFDNFLIHVNWVLGIFHQSWHLRFWLSWKSPFMRLICLRYTSKIKCRIQFQLWLMSASTEVQGITRPSNRFFLKRGKTLPLAQLSWLRTPLIHCAVRKIDIQGGVETTFAAGSCVEKMPDKFWAPGELSSSLSITILLLVLLICKP